jgi:hypothetical protein
MPGTFECGACGEGFPSREALRKHIFEAHIQQDADDAEDRAQELMQVIAGQSPEGKPTPDWVRFFSGEYTVLTRANDAEVWGIVGRVQMNFFPNGELDEHDRLCMMTTFRLTVANHVRVIRLFFHLKRRPGAHLTGQKHPGNWHGHAYLQPDPFLDGGVAEGEAVGGGVPGEKRYFRLGVWEATDMGETTWYPTGPVRIKFEGKEYVPVAEPKNQVRLVSTRKKPRPSPNYPWNQP